MIKKLLFRLFNLFFVNHYYHFCSKKIRSLPQDKQLFFITRRDFGTYIQLFHYIARFEEERGKAALVVLTGYFDLVKDLASLITPSTDLIGLEDPYARFAVRFFGARRVHLESFAPVYARLAVDYAEALYLYNQASCYPPPSKGSAYHSFFDPLVTNTSPFIKAYTACRGLMDYQEACYKDMLALCGNPHDLRQLYLRLQPLVEGIKADLNIRRPYVLLNINCKDYTEQDPSANRKKISDPARYNVIIDFLIEKGFDIVIQGRKEQYVFAHRPGLIDYAKSPYASVKNDLALYRGAAFAVISKTGPENFATLVDTPLLGLNYVELTVMTPSRKLRFYPKNILKLGRKLSWKELLQAPCFFDLGKKNFDPEVVYEELSEEDLLKATSEFLQVYQEGNWEQSTPLQKEFKESLTPLHLDLYRVKALPCDSYLA